ncbi:hypothetical protein JCGZ_17134 [Jatropha curcas]|uniref:Uncharacterized protein n=1 Tax=Jatropha curcas TaxID=180498 RepID=A0A067K2J2_JATCU|nr:hypothetical protein JCGZ_17134 [Jatropha curcas]
MRWRSVPLAILDTVPAFPRSDRTSSGADMNPPLLLSDAAATPVRSSNSGDISARGRHRSSRLYPVSVFPRLISTIKLEW